jgi:hypothetical protein
VFVLMFVALLLIATTFAFILPSNFSNTTSNVSLIATGPANDAYPA